MTTTANKLEQLLKEVKNSLRNLDNFWYQNGDFCEFMLEDIYTFNESLDDLTVQSINLLEKYQEKLEILKDNI